MRTFLKNRAVPGLVFIDGDVIRAVYGSIDTYWRMTDEVFSFGWR